MATGEVALVDQPGAAVVTHVRLGTGVIVKVVPDCGPVADEQIFSSRQLQQLDDILNRAEEATGLRFAAYVGDLGEDTRAAAEQLLDAFGDDTAYTALVAVSPEQRVIEIVTGTEAALRISERGCRAAVLSAVAYCGDGNLYGGLTNAIRILTDHAGEA